MSLVAELEQRKLRATEDARKQYAKLIASDDAGDAKVTQLESVVNALGKTHSDVWADRQAIKEVQALEAELLGEAGLRAIDDRVRETQAECLANIREEMKRVIDSLDFQVLAASSQSPPMSGRWQQCEGIIKRKIGADAERVNAARAERARLDRIAQIRAAHPSVF
jgi:hypothetical protein